MTGAARQVGRPTEEPQGPRVLTRPVKIFEALILQTSSQRLLGRREAAPGYKLHELPHRCYTQALTLSTCSVSLQRTELRFLGQTLNLVSGVQVKGQGHGSQSRVSTDI